MAAYRPIFERASRDGVELTGAIATAFGCPYEGPVDPERVLQLATQFVEAGVAEVDFADTVGMAVPPCVSASTSTTLAISVSPMPMPPCAMALTCSTPPPAAPVDVPSRPRPPAIYRWTISSLCSKRWESKPALIWTRSSKPRAGSKNSCANRCPRCCPRPGLAGNLRRRSLDGPSPLSPSLVVHRAALVACATQ